MYSELVSEELLIKTFCDDAGDPKEFRPGKNDVKALFSINSVECSIPMFPHVLEPSEFVSPLDWI